MTKQYSQDDLNKVLWSAADSARGTVDAVVYKDYALTMLFFKYLSGEEKFWFRIILNKNLFCMFEYISFA